VSGRLEANWSGVEELLTRLTKTRTKFATASSGGNWISQYEPQERLLLENDNGSRWVRIEDLRDCWATFERLGRIHRRDVLDPGRCSGFVMALFARVEGVVAEDAAGGEFLILPGVESRKGQPLVAVDSPE
jgi:hypothetical protein